MPRKISQYDQVTFGSIRRHIETIGKREGIACITILRSLYLFGNFFFGMNLKEKIEGTSTTVLRYHI